MNRACIIRSVTKAENPAAAAQDKASGTRRRRLLATAALLLSLAGCTGSAPPPASSRATAVEQGPDAAALQTPTGDLAAAIQARVSSGSDPLLGPLTRAEQAELASLYETGAPAPLWVDPGGRPTRNARDALALLDDAAAEGLDPGDYAVQALRRLATALEMAERPPAADAAAFDAAMSAATLRYFRHLHLGRVDPRAIGFKVSLPADHHDFARLLRSALGGQRIPEAAAELAPPLAPYRLLRGALGRYRLLAADPTLDPLPPFAGTVHPGESYGGLRALHRRLVVLGDLPPDTPVPREGSPYGGAVAEGLKRFQARQGLDADGLLGRTTHAALDVPPAWRIRQIELALERLRWLPDLGNQRVVALNIPMFHLWAWDSIPPDGMPSFGMRAIVGRALSTETPMFVEDMRYLIFRPYWNVPRSILRNEILPILDRDPAYPDREDMEIVQGPGDDARPVEATAENLARLRQGALRLRQRPGPRNALGLVKFVFPNNENVYLHGTPARELFARTRRDFSHGCVRVEDPVRLAEWVLNDQPEWTGDRIVAAMSGTRPRRVNLTRPIQVILFYVTAMVWPEDGTVHFAEDIYGHDARLDRALQARPAR